MKRIFALVLALLACALSLSAQSGLKVEQFFDGRYKRRADATDITVSGKQAKAYGLTLFRSISIEGRPSDISDIENAVKVDGARATDKEVGTKGGRLYYGFYRLPPRDRLNRYLFYRNSTLSGHRSPGVTLIYMEGTATIEEIKKNFLN